VGRTDRCALRNGDFTSLMFRSRTNFYTGEPLPSRSERRKRKPTVGVFTPTALPDDEPEGYVKVGMTPNIFDLEEALKLLAKRDPVNVMMTRTQLKWMMKASEKTFGVQFRHPYKGGTPKI
jgi:hypothetical protein